MECYCGFLYARAFFFIQNQVTISETIRTTTTNTMMPTTDETGNPTKLRSATAVADCPSEIVGDCFDAMCSLCEVSGVKVPAKWCRSIVLLKLVIYVEFYWVVMFWMPSAVMVHSPLMSLPMPKPLFLYQLRLKVGVAEALTVNKK